MRKREWLNLLFQNRKPIISLAKEGLVTWRNARKNKLKGSVNENMIENV